jgi:hypothetical protein
VADQQAAMLGFLDCFHVLGWIAFASLILALASKPFRFGPGGRTGE